MAAEASEAPKGRASAWSDGAALTMGAIILSGLAFGLTNHRCSSDGSYDPFDPNAIRSSYCGTLHYPRFPNAIGGVVLAFTLFVLASLIMLTGTLVAGRTNGQLPLRTFALLGAVILIISFSLIPLANSGYRGVG